MNAPLGAGPDGQVAVRVPEGGGVLRFDVALVHRSSVEFAFDHVIGLREALVHVALFVAEPIGDVAVLVGFFAELGGGQVFVQQRGVVFHGVEHVGTGRQNLVVDLDQRGGLLCDVRRIGGDAGDGVAAEQRLGAG